MRASLLAALAAAQEKVWRGIRCAKVWWHDLDVDNCNKHLHNTTSTIMDKATLIEALISQVEQCPARLDVRSQARSSMKMYGKRAAIHAAVKCSLKAKFAYNPRSAC